jgi:two-component system sensor histidine kinase VicK
MKGMQFFRTVQLKLIVIYLLMILFAMQLIGAYFMNTLENSVMRNFSDSLNKETSLLAGYVENYLQGSQDGKVSDVKKSYDDLNVFISNWNTISNAEIQVLDENGLILATSQNNMQGLIGQKNTQTVVSRALQGIREKDNERIIIDTDGIRKKTVAMPVGSSGKVVGVVYVLASLEDSYSMIHRINKIFMSGTILALVLTAGLGVVLANTITNPIKEITRQAASVAEGNFNQQLQIRGYDEIGQLSRAFNYMTSRLKEALSLNEEERDKLASVLANMSDGVLATNENGTVILINRRARQMLQLKEKDALGMDVFKILGIERQKEHEQSDSNVAVVSVKPDNDEELKLRVTFTAIYRRDRGGSIGTAGGTIVVLQDVTEQETLEQARREFVANVSHELRTPLTTMKSYLEALEDGAIEDAQLASRFIGVTRSETERMIRLVSDLLHLSRFDSKQSGIVRVWTDVHEMLEEVTDRFSFQLKQRQMSIDVVIENGVNKVWIDRDKIDQVLDNLVSNAIKFTADGGHIQIHVSSIDQVSLEISVKDNGIGIPKKDLNRIFERFYRVDKARSRNMGGTGLGLSIAREIIRAHNGEIEIESEYSRGTKVTFTLPINGEGNGAL